MKVSDLMEIIDARLITDSCSTDRDIMGVYVGDLLSWVMSHANRGNAWITVHTHLNIVAVAMLSELSCIIIPENIDVESATIEKAEKENIPILNTALNSYDVCCRIYEALKEENSY